MTPKESRKRARAWVAFGLLAILGEAFVWHYFRFWFFLVGGTHLLAFIAAALRYGWANGYEARQEEQGGH